MELIRALSNSAHVQFQGGLVALRTFRPVHRTEQQTKRGIITTFSQKSRLRMMKLLQRVDFNQTNFTFITLTYPEKYPLPELAKRHHRAFLKRLKRFASAQGVKVGNLWRLEPQKRGAPHFHYIISNCPFIPFRTIRKWWAEIIQYEKPRVRIQFCHDKKRTMYYLSKYVAKVEKDKEFAFSSSFFIPVPKEAAQSIGRQWGVEGRDNFPLCEAQWFSIVNAWEVVNQFKRYARRYYKGINKRGYTGFCLFVEDSAQWQALFFNTFNAFGSPQANLLQHSQGTPDENFLKAIENDIVFRKRE